MKKLYIALLVFVLIITAGCGSEAKKECFFGWMDGYLAMGSDEEFKFALTLFFERGNRPFKPGDVTGLAFEGLEEIVISDYSVSAIDNLGRYRRCVFYITVKPAANGLFKTGMLAISLGDSCMTLPIGSWTFDVADISPPSDAEELIYIWESHAAGSNPRTFAYEYEMKQDGAKLIEIWLSEDICISDEDGLLLSDDIEFPDTMEAPVNFIRPKLIIDTGTEKVKALGMSYYSGAMGFGEEVLLKSKEYSLSQLQ